MRKTTGCPFGHPFTLKKFFDLQYFSNEVQYSCGSYLPQEETDRL